MKVRVFMLTNKNGMGTKEQRAETMPIKKCLVNFLQIHLVNSKTMARWCPSMENTRYETKSAMLLYLIYI